MTRYEIHDAARVLAKAIAPSITVDTQMSLLHISDAEQKIEKATGVIKRRAKITLNNQAQGEYALPSDFKALDGVWWAAKDGDAAVWPVEIRTPQRLNEIIARTLLAAPPLTPPAPNEGGTLYLTIGFGQITGNANVISIFPKEATGIIVLRYKPHVTVYSPASPEWAAYATPNTESKMKAETPDESLKDAYTGIVKYLAAQMLRQQAHGIERFGAEIMSYERDFRESIYPVARESIETGINQSNGKLRPMGGMR